MSDRTTEQSGVAADELWMDDVVECVREKFGEDVAQGVFNALWLQHRLRVELPSLESYMEEYDLDYDDAILNLVVRGLEAS